MTSPSLVRIDPYRLVGGAEVQRMTAYTHVSMEEVRAANINALQLHFDNLIDQMIAACDKYGFAIPAQSIIRLSTEVNVVEVDSE